MVRVGDVVRSVVKASDRGGGLLKARAAELWPEVSGPEIAQHTLGMGVRGTTLEVHVDSHAWATQLALLAPELCARLNSALGEKAVSDIRFTVSRTVSDAAEERAATESAFRRYGGERVEPASLSQEEVEQIGREAATIENETLRSAAIRARISDLKVKKAQQRDNEP